MQVQDVIYNLKNLQFHKNNDFGAYISEFLSILGEDDEEGELFNHQDNM